VSQVDGYFLGRSLRDEGAEREVWVEAVDRAGVGAGAAAGGGLEVEGAAAVLEAEVVALAVSAAAVVDWGNLGIRLGSQEGMLP